MTRGSVVIGWSSNEYIGVGDQLEYSVGQSLDVTQRGVIDSNTIASFINDTDDNGTPVLVSQLRIIVSSISSTPSVTCIHGSNNIRNISTFQVLGMYNVMYLASLIKLVADSYFKFIVLDLLYNF